MTPYDYALLAQEAYVAAPDIGVADSASRAIARDTPDGLVIAFPGSDNESCWASDFDVELVSVPGAGRLHKGFWKAWQAIRLDVLSACAGRPVTLVGHSLGAAIAIVAACDMAVSGNPAAAVYGFEPPRVTPDSTIAPLLSHTPICLFKNGNDIVPNLPPGWEHPTTLTAIGKAELPFPNIEDHMMVRVIEALSEKA